MLKNIENINSSSINSTDHKYDKYIYSYKVNPICYYPIDKVDDNDLRIIKENWYHAEASRRYLRKYVANNTCKCSEKKDTSPCIVNIQNFTNTRDAICPEYDGCETVVACYENVDDSPEHNIPLSRSVVTKYTQYLSDCTHKFDTKIKTNYYTVNDLVLLIFFGFNMFMISLGIQSAKKYYNYMKRNANGQGAINNFNIEDAGLPAIVILGQSLLCCFNILFVCINYLFRKLRTNNNLNNQEQNIEMDNLADPEELQEINVVQVDIEEINN